MFIQTIHNVDSTMLYIKQSYEITISNRQIVLRYFDGISVAIRNWTVANFEDWGELSRSYGTAQRYLSHRTQKLQSVTPNSKCS